jgi:hypothetical protein
VAEGQLCSTANSRKARRACSARVQDRGWNIPSNVGCRPSTSNGDHAMRKTLIAVAAAATVAVATVATPSTAEARRGWWGPAIGAFAVGAIVGSAFARPYYGGYYGGYYPSYSSYPAYGYSYPSYGYSYAPAYYGYAYAPRPYYSCWRYGYRVC